MNILAFDSASVSCSACVTVDAKLRSEIYMNTALTHSQTLLPAIDEALKKADLTINDIDEIAVTAGPGSFTGIKIGVSTAKGLAFARSIPCRAVSTLEALAYNVRPFRGTAVCVMDARRGCFYNALFKLTAKGVERLTEDRQIDFEALAAELHSPFIVVGDGTELFCNMYKKKTGRSPVTAPQSTRFISAASVAEIAALGGGQAVGHKQLSPIYLRPPQAERERLEKLNSNK